MTADIRPQRRPRRHPIAKMYYRLRMRRDTPRQRALAVLMGVTVGCSPLFGLHLPMCIVLAKIMGVSAVTAYLASYVNNPFVAPFTLYLSLGVGHWLFTGEWPTLLLDHAHATSVWYLGRDVLMGSLIVGLTLGALLAGLVYRFSSRHEERVSLTRRLTEATARRYLDTGIFNWEFVHGKLKLDTLYLGLLKAAILPHEGRLLDLGCGRGIVLAMLETARRMYASGEWQPSYPPPPSKLKLSGVDACAQDIATARSALDASAELRVANLEEYQPSPSEAVLLLDVLHYLRPHQQRALVARITAALSPGGVLLIREADADAGIRFALTRIAERIHAAGRSHSRQCFHYRGKAAWVRLLEDHGFKVKTHFISRGTPFANTLFEAYRV